MTIEEIEKAGYRKYGNDLEDMFNNSDYYYAKMLKDDIGKKYQIVIYVYDFSKYNVPERDSISFQPEVQFRDDNFCVNVIYLLNKDDSLAKVEEYYEKLWEFHNKPYYSKWD